MNNSLELWGGGGEEGEGRRVILGPFREAGPSWRGLKHAIQFGKVSFLVQRIHCSIANYNLLEDNKH